MEPRISMATSGTDLLEVPTIYKTYVRARGYNPQVLWLYIWYSRTSNLGSQFMAIDHMIKNCGLWNCWGPTHGAQDVGLNDWEYMLIQGNVCGNIYGNIHVYTLLMYISIYKLEVYVYTLIEVCIIDYHKVYPCTIMYRIKYPWNNPSFSMFFFYHRNA
jgi:hypothetical protein